MLHTLFITLFYCTGLFAQDAIHSGVPWFDQNGKIVSAHGANIVKDGNKFYLFGEKHSDTSNAFAGFSCYSSVDLYNWKDEGIALGVQSKGRLGPNRVGERAKVMKCPKTGEYIMLMHTDSLGYKDPCIGYATAKTIAGPYAFKGPVLFNGTPIRKWDMGTFQDSDGAGYLLIHGGLMYKLSDDYTSITEEVVDNKWKGSESPAIFKRNGIYYWLVSDLTSWERNDNVYYTATSLNGPWVPKGFFAPESSLTWNSQTTFVLQITGSKETTYMFMGDRWSFPLQASAATYVWQPLTFTDDAISIPNYYESWKINTATGMVSGSKLEGKTVTASDKSIRYTGQWKQGLNSISKTETNSNATNAKLSYTFKGSQVALYGTALPIGGYAGVTIKDSKGSVVVTTIIDMYCKYAQSGLRFLSPVLKKGSYTIEVTVMGQHSKWSDKRKNDYGSTGNVVSIEKLLVH
ncbi:family 43 glycosylhydrolase [Flavobacterium zepuense]|uniref:Family 43 glycosylhydrolase n=1 Tax=Flavobacterium zepuense TaxID=2593302 RepID=A0A552V0Q3_9FLAO|nr:family 43 glycosylhydrolase [Flavobacterium zepuense]